MTSAEPSSYAPTDRTTLKRLADRGSYDRDLVHSILDEALYCHLAYNTGDGPVAIPTVHARDGESVLVHGSAASRTLRFLEGGADVCLVVTLIDGLVVARSAFHHSINYRSVVVYGKATAITDLGEKSRALDAIVEHVWPGRRAALRPHLEKEVRATTVLSIPLDEVSAKVRTGGPVDEPDDLGLPVWGGVVPLRLVAADPIPDDHVTDATAGLAPDLRPAPAPPCAPRDQRDRPWPTS